MGDRSDGEVEAYDEDEEHRPESRGGEIAQADVVTNEEDVWCIIFERKISSHLFIQFMAFAMSPDKEVTASQLALLFPLMIEDADDEMDEAGVVSFVRLSVLLLISFSPSHCSCFILMSSTEVVEISSAPQMSLPTQALLLLPMHEFCTRSGIVSETCA